MSRVLGRIIVWIVTPQDQTTEGGADPGYIRLPPLRPSAMRGILPTIQYTKSYGGWCPTIMDALLAVSHSEPEISGQSLVTESLSWLQIGREHVQLAQHALAIHLLVSDPCTLVLGEDVVKQRASDVESLRKQFDRGRSSSNPSEDGVSVALAFFVPDPGSASVSQFNSPSALRHWMNRLSPASVPKTAEAVVEVSSDLIAIFSPRVILLAPSRIATLTDQMLVRLTVYMVDAVAVALAQLVSISGFRSEIGVLHESDHGWSRLIPRAFRLRESRIRRRFYAFRSKWWWARPSNHSLVALTWSMCDEMHGLTEMVRQVDEELSDYSASAREDLERFIAIGGLTLGSLAIYESVVYAELGPGRPWLTIGVPALAALSALIVAALRPVVRSRRSSLD